MSTILVVDDMTIFREPIAASLRLAGYCTLTAGNGQEAVALLKETRPDLILLDLAMPVMDGMTFLSALRDDPNTREVPVILLTADTDKERVVQAAKLGITDYLLKSRFSLQELLARVKRRVGGFDLPEFQHAVPKPTNPATTRPAPRPASDAAMANLQPSAAPATGPAALADDPPTQSPTPRSSMGSREIPRLLTKETCLTRMANSLQTKALSGIVTQVAALAVSPRGDTAGLAATIMRDPVLTARVMQVANSAAYISNSGPASSVKEAVRRMGFTEVRNIAMALGIFDIMPESDMEGFNPIRHWQHSLGVAALCEHLATETDPEADGTAYLLGICHDLGEILFYRHFAKEYQQVIETAANTGRSRAELELLMLGISRAELELLLVKTLGLPVAIQKPITQFQDDSQAGNDGPRGPLQILRLANAYANGLLLASSPSSPVRGLSCAECRSGTGKDHPDRPKGVVLQSETLSLTAMLARKSDDAALRPYYPKRDRNVLLVRTPGLSSFDPVEAALASLANVTAASLLPDKYAGIDALVILSPSSSLKGFTADDIGRVKPAPDGKTVPVLWLVGHYTPVPNITLPPVLWPITLERLAEFIRLSGQIESRDQISLVA